MVERPGHRRTTETLLRQFAVVAILGPRQIGKTTLARRPVAGRSRGVTSFDLEDAGDQTLRVLVDEPGVASWPGWWCAAVGALASSSSAARCRR